jgi:NAD(P)-dependent dehydrogenase (short-subunit alcohol dehydrogenase family)
MGKALSLRMAKEGYHVIMLCRDPERGKKAFEEVTSLSGSSKFIWRFVILPLWKASEPFLRGYINSMITLIFWLTMRESYCRADM